MRLRKPTPSLAIALVALFFALGGIGTAATTAIVPLAKRALSADNAKKLNKKTLNEVAELPGPARTTTNTSSTTIGPQQGVFATASCDPGQTAISGGYSFSSGAVLAADTYPLDETTWRIFLVNVDPAASAAVTVYVVCLDAESSGSFRAPASSGDHADVLPRLEAALRGA
jgi:hypothetical protein